MQAQIEMIELADRVSRMSTSVTQTTGKLCSIEEPREMYYVWLSIERILC